MANMNFGDIDMDEARYNRANRMNSPEHPVGQGDNSIFQDSASVFNDSINTNQTQTNVGSLFDTGVDNNSNNNSNSFNSNQQPQQQVVSQEDAIWNTLASGCKGVFKVGLPDLINSFSGLTLKFYTDWGQIVGCIGLAEIGIGFFSKFLGYDKGLSIAIGGCICGAIGFGTLLFTNDKSRRYTSYYKDESNTRPLASNPEPTYDSSSSFDDFTSSDSSSGGSLFDQSNDDFDSDESFFGDEDVDDDGDDDDDWGESWSGFGEEEEKVEMTPEEAIKEFQPIDKGMYTRQYLYENFVKVLPTILSDFTHVEVLTADDDDFIVMEDMVLKACEVTGVSADLLEDSCFGLLEYTENIFTIKLTMPRLSKMKPDLIADELAKAYAYQVYDDDEDRARVFATAESVLDKCIITIFTGKNHMISLKDMYAKCESFVLDRNVAMPIVLGINEKGKVITLDFKNVESMIVAGMPRSGKSWLVQAILTQLCAYLSPKDVIFYILDPKAGTSDYKDFCLPHVKKFASRYIDANGKVVNDGTLDIMETLRFIINKEAPRRRELIANGGCINISDFKKKHPDIELPYLYIVIDEMVTLSSMEKSIESEYQSYLDQIVTQFPNLGIRGIFIPHEVKNQIISKTAYDSIKSRISVKGNEAHVEASTGTKPAKFKYKLRNKGDMAVNIDEVAASTIFVHGTVLTSDNEDNKNLFNYLRKIWSKLEPGCVEDSMAKVAEQQESDKELLKQLEDDLDDIEVFGNIDEAGISKMENVKHIYDDDTYKFI